MRELHSSIELYAHGVTLLVARDWDSPRRQFQITGPKYHLTVLACGCERTPCVGRGVWRGRCKEADKKGKDGANHNRYYCHASTKAMHAEHVMVLAEAVLKTYNPKAKPSTPTAGVPAGQRIMAQNFLPLEGQEHVATFRDLFGDSKFWRVVCNAVRCRDEQGRVRPLPEVYGDEDAARKAVQQHKDLHTAARLRTPEGCPRTNLAGQQCQRSAPHADWCCDFGGKR